jgi:hypothetical protein
MDAALLRALAAFAGAGADQFALELGKPVIVASVFRRSRVERASRSRRVTVNTSRLSGRGRGAIGRGRS